MLKNPLTRDKIAVACGRLLSYDATAKVCRRRINKEWTKSLFQNIVQDYLWSRSLTTLLDIRCLRELVGWVSLVKQVPTTLPTTQPVRVV